MLEKATPAGLAGEKLSRALCKSTEVSAKRSVIAAGSGAGLGYLTASGVALGLKATGLAGAAAIAAPAVIPITLAAGGIALIRSLLD